MKRYACWVSLALTVFALLGLALPEVAAQTVVNVSGTVVHIEPAGPSAFETKNGGDLAGDLFAVIYQVLNPELDGTLRWLAVDVWLTPQGNLYALADAVLTPMRQGGSQTNYDVKERKTIIGGSGKYKGATGEIDLTGPFDLSTGAGSLRYSGKISLPQ